MVRLTSLVLYNSISNITEEINKFKLYLFLQSKIGGVTNEKVRDEIEKDMEILNITATDLHEDIISLLIFEEKRKEV